MGCCDLVVVASVVVFVFVFAFFFIFLFLFFDSVVFSGSGGDGFGGLLVVLAVGLMEREEERSVKCILYYYLMVDLYYFNGLNLKIEMSCEMSW